MKKFLVLLATLLMCMVVLLPAPATASPAIRCGANVTGSNVRVVCNLDGMVVLNISLPLDLPPPVTVTVRPPQVTVTAKVQVPGPTRTVRVEVPGSKETVTVKVPGQTVTKTVTKEGKTITVTKSPNAGPTQTVTRETVSEKIVPRTGQESAEHAKIEDEASPGLFSGPIDFGDEKTTPAEVGIGVLSLLALMCIVLSGMYAGYILGYKESRDADTNMWRALRDELIPRGKHR